MNLVFTKRLTLHMPDQGHIDELFDLYADPRVWRDDPVTRHTTIEQTAQLVDRWRMAWQRHEIGMWVATSSLPSDFGELVGIGGCAIRHDVAWNLGFRLRPRYWGHGLAQEIISAAVTAATQSHPELPITAYHLEGNERSRRTTELANLRLVWRGPDASNPDATAVRLLYADRPLSEHVVSVLTRD